MRFKKLLVVGAAALAAVGALTGGAMAGGAKGSDKPAAVVTTVDGDTIQSGDQTAPDSTANENPGENPESSAETEGSTENSPESDGPGGHEDAAGQNVDYQFDGEQ
jgi:hypothetical protein